MTIAERDSVVVVTGASGGVGRALIRRYARRGGRLALLARGGEGLDGAAAEVRRLGGEPLPVSVDVADAGAVLAAADRIEDEFGPIGTWINNAFSSIFAPFTEIDLDEFRRATEVTYLGYVYGTKAALSKMLPRDRGVVVHVGSALAYRGIPLQSVYCGAKHAIQGFHESLRCELLHDRRHVYSTMVQLPAVNTPQFDWLRSRLRHKAQPVAPIYQPEVAARAIMYAADHPRRREYWVGGSTVATLLANAVAPGLLDRYLARTGFDSQQTPQPNDPDGAGNLWKPADGQDGHDWGAHGRFDDVAHERSPQVWASQHHALVLAGAAALAAAGVATVRAARRG
jgi:NAD(P)-dependent dehydrogenase (short-subunit alcohol dehydrogenase family)